jgi:5-methylcytosine-specific restriction endonuclease McrA
VDNILTWVRRLCRWVPVSHLAIESVRFDTQALQQPEISGVQYQQGTLAGYEVRAYLLEKWGRRCAYCDRTDRPLQVEHILARTHGGTDRVSNLTLACGPCNKRKGNRRVEEFLAHDPARLARLLAQARAPLRDAAAVNSTRRAVLRALTALGLPVETATGGRTKWNRTRLHLPKTHALDALCVGHLFAVQGWAQPPLLIQATGRGQHQRTRVTASGFPRGYLTRTKRHFGFCTGDLVQAVVPTGTHRGVHVGRVAVRARGSFALQTALGRRSDIAHRYCALLQRADGYAYGLRPLPQRPMSCRKQAAAGAADDISSVA